MATDKPDNTTEQSPIPTMFKGPANSIKTLRQAARPKLLDLDIGNWASTLTHESDRSVIILVAALLDDALAYCISKKFSFVPTEEQFDQIFKFEGPIGSFSARIEIAFLFGAITDDTYAQLDIIREMRNACAHSIAVLDFSNPALENVAKRLFRYDGLLSLPPNGETMATKIAVIMEGMFLSATLILGSREEAKKRHMEAISRFAAEQLALQDKSP